MSCLNSQTSFCFVDPSGTSTTLQLSEQTGRVAAIAAMLATRIPRDSIVGLLYRSEPNLVLAWLACISAGLKPLILQYPTRKQARTYWSDSIANTVASVGIAGIVADDHCTGLLGGVASIVVPQSELEGLQALPGGDPLPDAFSIVQLSSGTTGYRKAIEFTSTKLARHVADYNTALGLTAEDKIASWLPLYHDMGYIACFVMPMMLGIDVVMMDPITWVQRPGLLIDAIEAHAATLCYMPNFGFEVLARTALRPLPSMRRWISCSEPVSAVTSRKFLGALNAPETVFSPCYAMAENIFAVTLGEGCRTLTIGDTEIVSCGRAIPGVDIRTVDGEIWVRSPTAMVSYLGGESIRDADGFYPTGDLGEIVDGELFVAGRKHDLLIQAGRKFILSDIDLRLNELFSDVRGRGAALALRDDRFGTEMPIVLIEAADFFGRRDGAQIAAALKDATGLDQIDVAFVPPRFLTKTSSGKVNRRKTVADWAAVQAARTERRTNKRDPRAELAASFASIDWDRPVREALDSLAVTMLRIILDATPVAFDGNRTLRDIDATLDQARAEVAAEAAAPEGLRIVSLANRLTMQNIKQPELDRLSTLLGCRVSFEHLCLPPSPMLMSDLIFHDYFRPRLNAHGFAAVDYAMQQIKSASLILVDDIAEFCFLYESTYPVLSHNLERDPQADLVSFRWQQYTKSHHLLPLTIASGLDIPLAASAQTMRQMAEYLHTPIYRIALMHGLSDYTADWDIHAFGTDLKGLSMDSFIPALADWVNSLPERPATRPLGSGAQIVMSDLGHFCSHAVNKDAIDQIVSQYDRFCISGGEASLPYVREKLAAENKPYVQVPSHSQSIIGELRESFDCLLLCGSVGSVGPDIPAVALQHADEPWRTKNLGSLAGSLPPLTTMPVSGTDWFHTFELKRGQDYSIWGKARQLLAEDRVRQRAALS